MEALNNLLSDLEFFDTLCTSTTGPLVLPFVNRKEEIISLSATLIQNSLNATMGVTDNQVYLLPFLPQMFGAGKTTMGQQLLERAKQYKDEIFLKLHKSNTTYQSQLLNDQLDTFLGSTYVQISLSDLPSPQSTIATFTEALMSLTKASLTQALKLPLVQLQPTHTMRELVKSLTQGHSVVLHFDDVGSILGTKYNAYFVELDRDPKWEMQRIYKFWDEIHFLNKMDGTYSFISGKRSALIFLGLKILHRERVESPTGAKSVILALFEPRYIRELADQLGLWDILGITAEALKVDLVLVLYHLTGGVPRLVSFSLKVLINGAHRLGTFIKALLRTDELRTVLRELLYRVFTHDERSNVLAVSEMLASPTTNNIYLRLLVLSLRGKSIDKNTKIMFRDDDTGIPLSVIVSAVDCYVAKEVGSEWYLAFPELVLLWVAENTQNQRLSFFTSSILDDVDISRPSAVHEKIFRLTLETLLTNDPVRPRSAPLPLGTTFPFLAGTSVEAWRLRMEPNGFVPLPKIQKHNTLPLTSEQKRVLAGVVSRPRNEWLTTLQHLSKRQKGVQPTLTVPDAKKLRSFLTSTAHFSDSGFILEHLLPNGYLGCPTHSMSGWPDFVLVEHTSGLGSTIYYALWWQIKLYGDDTPFAWTHVKDEVEKVPLVAQHQCLVIVSTHLNTEILNSIGQNTHLMLAPGSIRGVLQVPANLYVVILGEKGLASFYSEYDLQGLLLLAREDTFEAISRRIVRATPPLSNTTTLSASPVPLTTDRTVRLNFVKNGVEVAKGMTSISMDTALAGIKDLITTELWRRVPGAEGILRLEYSGVVMDEGDFRHVHHNDVVTVIFQ